MSDSDKQWTWQPIDDIGPVEIEISHYVETSDDDATHYAAAWLTGTGLSFVDDRSGVSWGQHEYRLCRRVPATGAAVYAPQTGRGQIDVPSSGCVICRDWGTPEEDAAWQSLEEKPATGSAPTWPGPDWTTAPEWANYAIPLLTWSSLEGALLRWEWYQNEPVWGERAWRWVSGRWGPGKNGSADAVPVHEVIGMRHMLRQRPAVTQAQEGK